MKFHELLRVAPGITCVVGSGGKTSLLGTLARELEGTVVLTTSTHILPFPELPLLADPSMAELRGALAHERVLCVGTPGERGKLSSPERCSFAELASLADYVLVEADGSRRLPLKAHESREPVVVEGSRQTIVVVGASGFGRPAREVTHRWGLFCERAEILADAPVRPTDVARALRRERELGILEFDVMLVNQVDGKRELREACGLAEGLGASTPVVAASLQDRSGILLR